MSDPTLPPSLVEGYRRFRHTSYRAERDRYQQLAVEGQRPRVLVVACSDSRAAPETVFDAGPGELFVVRNVAAIVPVYEPDTRHHAASAALEYGVLALGVESIVIMGHGRCGGIAAAYDGAAPLTATDFIGTWVAGLGDIVLELDPADRDDPDRARRRLEFRSVEASIRHLRTFPWIASRELAGSLTLAGCWFDIALGELHRLEGDRWVPEAPG